MRRSHALCLLSITCAGTFAAACGPDAAAGDDDPGGTTTDAGELPDPPDAAPPRPDAAPRPDAGPEEPCAPPQLMIVLDRSGSFARRPDGTLPPNTPDGRLATRWHIAVTAVETVSAALADQVQFGLALFPNDPDGAGGTDCSNLATWLEEYLPPETNDLACQPGEVLVSPTLDNGAAMAAAIDTETTGLCSWTPIGAGLAAAQAELAAIVDRDLDQVAVLITDGTDNCDSDEGYGTTSLPTADAMAAAGIDTFVVGFDGTGDDLDPAHLNDLACAGHTAIDFAANCQAAGGGYRAVAAPSPARLYVLATEAASLEAAISEIASQVSCEGGVD